MLKKGRHIIMVFFLLVGLTACDYTLKEDPPPQDLIPMDTFQQVLHDVMVIEAYYGVKKANIQAHFDSLKEVIHPIFQKYHIDSSRFNRSMGYYAYQREKLVKMYENIQQSLEKYSPKDTVITSSK